MEFNICLCFFLYILFLNKHGFVSGKAMIGHNIRQAQRKEFPFVVSLMRLQRGSAHSGGKHYCTGVLITKKDVLTAAHCVIRENLNNIQLIIGTNDLREGSIFYPFWWTTHDQWASTNNITINFDKNDLANIRLLKRIPKNFEAVQISRLPYTDLYGEMATIAGWGVNNEGVVPDILNMACVKIMTNEECSTKLSSVQNKQVTVNVRILCSEATPFTLTEIGDSGGPLLFRNKLVGISKGTSPGDVIPDFVAQVNVHMCLQLYADFIQHMKNIAM